MSKKLIENFRNDCLDCGFYYASIPDEGVIILRSSDRHYLETSDGDKIDILSAVPSYEELQKMKEQLEEANECIKDKYHITCSYCSLLGSCMSCGNRYFGRYIKKWGVK